MDEGINNIINQWLNLILKLVSEMKMEDKEEVQFSCDFHLSSSKRQFKC